MLEDDNDDNNNNIGNFLGNLLNNKNLQNTFMNLASQMSSHLINCDFINQILDSHPNLTDEVLTQHINSFKKDNPDVNILIDKYLKRYQTQNSNKSVYQIREFVKSSNCKKVLEDPDVQKYINQIINSSQFKDKFQQLLSQYFNQQSSKTE